MLVEFVAVVDGRAGAFTPGDVADLSPDAVVLLGDKVSPLGIEPATWERLHHDGDIDLMDPFEQQALKWECRVVKLENSMARTRAEIRAAREIFSG